MQITTHVKLFKTLQDIILGDGSATLPHNASPKPVMPLSQPGFVPLLRSTPEAQGIPSQMLADFYSDIAGSKSTSAHTLMVLRNGKLIAEGNFSPYRSDIWHVSHSLCKTFTGTAVGLAIEEGLFSLDDIACDFFPEKTSLLTSKRTRAVTVRHLLTMSSGVSYNELSEAVDSDWLKGFFSAKVTFEPGSEFSYNSMNSYVLAAIVHKTSGQSLMEFLRPRLFTPLGFGAIDWEQSSSGIEKGGWGMYLLPEDMAKLGQLYLQKGEWIIDGHPQTVLSSSWVEQATATHMSDDSGQHYGYQIWTDPDTATYVMNGMFGQYVYVVPHQACVVAMTSGSANVFANSEAYQTMVRYFCRPDAYPENLPEDPVSLGRLSRILAGLTFQKPALAGARVPRRVPAHTRAERWRLAHSTPGGLFKQAAKEFCDVTVQFDKNRGSLLPIIVQMMNNNFTTGVVALRLEFHKDTLYLFWEEGSGTFSFPVGIEAPAETVLSINGEQFLMAVQGFIRPNEDDVPVLTLHLYLLEHSSFRIIKLLRINDHLMQLFMDEQPKLGTAIESAIGQSKATRKSSVSSSFESFLSGNEYLAHKLQQLSAPSCIGEIIEDPEP